LKRLAKKIGCTVDMLYKHKRGDITMSKTMAKKAERATRIDRLKWMYPKEYGNPWVMVKKLRLI